MKGLGMRLTDQKLRGLKPTGQRLELSDDGIPLSVIVTAGGTKSFYFRGRQGGKSIRKKIGSYPDLNLSTAREYPDRQAPVLTSSNDTVELQVMKWGLPAWKEGMRGITNVRNLESGFWKSLLSNPESKCLVPVSSFCEWEGEKGNKRKVWFAMKNYPVFAFAGLITDGHFGFLTCEPNEIVAPVHPKAMPVILCPDNYLNWLKSDYAGAVKMASPFPADEMTIVDM